MKPKVRSLDHLVLTVADIAATVDFYTKVLGMHVEVFHPADGSTRAALKFGAQKINLHEMGREFEPKAHLATAGSADLCFLSDTPIKIWVTHLQAMKVNLVEGPVTRTGAAGSILSIYVRDPDQNLIEVSNSI